MENIDINLDKAKLICEGIIKLDKKKKIDSFSTINTMGYYRKLPLNNKDMLTIGTSSDEVINGMFYGLKNITLYNDNPISLYYYYLKIAGIISLSYDDFICFFFKRNFNRNINNKMFCKKLFKKVKPALKDIDIESYLFFDELFDLYGGRKVRDTLFYDNNYHSKVMRDFNVYLRNEETYDICKSNINNTNFNYIKGNILDNEINNKYDVINLASLCTDITLFKLIRLIDRLNINNLNDKGIIILAYLWKNDIYTEDYSNIWKKVFDNPLENKYLREFITNIYSINGYRDYLWEDCKKEDKVLIYRKKN